MLCEEAPPTSLPSDSLIGSVLTTCVHGDGFYTYGSLIFVSLVEFVIPTDFLATLLLLFRLLTEFYFFFIMWKFLEYKFK